MGGDMPATRSLPQHPPEEEYIQAIILRSNSLWTGKHRLENLY